MRKVICLSFLFLMLFSCEKNKKDLKLELLTNEVVCAENVHMNDFREVFYKPNKQYDSLSKNILHYKITNISDKKYFIMLNENNLGTVERDLYREALGRKDYTYNSIGFSMYKNDSILDGSSTRAENMCGNGFELMKIKELDTIVSKFLRKNRVFRKYQLEYVNDIDESLQGYFLQPGETKYFTSVMNLPYRNSQMWFSNIEKKKPNLGSLSLKNDSVFTNKKLSQDRKKEIKENGYVLFDGIIYSNKIPVKLIAIKK
ncbi:hypothetical protein C8C83_4644 [Flavobacterium sp. 90]|uniref:hypothetical protein n=1 Tax=unclassified Flavobacterium TaxID=196869 RepID=UPI000EB50DD9|nr:MULTISPECIES: hypothetical protein [unclassified Flavobacterium]RKR05303.1 hypothetical protein C8C82_4987 [Flavobacterium sp. 81]TCK56617.1 hypothetical protein C8C83_4644 [Flavobacterium sp. 90]